MSNSQTPKSLKHSRTLNSASSSSSAAAKSNLSSHMATVELKQRILSSLSKLSDRDTQQLAVEDLEKIIQTISPESLPMLLNCLFDSSNDPKPAVKKESLRLLPVVCHYHGELAATHLTKIVAHIVRRLRDADSGVREACRDAIGALSGQYLRGESGGGVLGVFVKPLFEAMGEQNKSVQSGAAICMAKMVECAIEPPQASFQKLCPRICKLLNNQNFLSKAALLPVVASLAQVGAIAPQSLESLLQSIHECLGNTDWATRKAAADTLSALALHLSNLIVDGAASTLAVLENCRFDKIKPVRDSMTEALQLWKKIAGKGDVSADDHDVDDPPQAEISEKNGLNNLNSNDEAAKNASDVSSPASNPVSKGKGRSISDKAVVILKKKAPALTERVLNPEFFQKLETRGSGDLPVEVAVPRRYLNSSNSKNEEESSQTTDSESRRKSNGTGTNQPEDFQGSSSTRYRNMERGNAGLRHNWPDNGKESRTRALDDDAIDANQRESQESFISNKGNWLAIQRQLSQLERQQVHLMNMLQDFMGGSHDGMVTLENRVRGLERIVEDMAHNLSVSSGRKGGNFTSGYEGSSNRPLGKYNGFPGYGSPKYNGQDGAASGMRGRGPPWRPDMTDDYEFPGYGGSKNGLVGNRRGWSKGPGGPGPVRLGEGPSARSVWQNSKDEATLEAIRVAGEDVGGTSRNTRVPELEAEAVGDSNVALERDPIWDSWSNALHSLQVGDIDSAYAEVASTGDDLLLVKLMDRSGPVLDQLSNEIANEVLHAISQLTLEQEFFDVCFLWIQQLAELVMENGSNVLGIPMELKKELLLSLHEVSAADSLEDWEGPTPNQLLIQLASAWGIEVQQFEK